VTVAHHSTHPAGAFRSSVPVDRCMQELLAQEKAVKVELAKRLEEMEQEARMRSSMDLSVVEVMEQQLGKLSAIIRSKEMEFVELQSTFTHVCNERQQLRQQLLMLQSPATAPQGIQGGNSADQRPIRGQQASAVAEQRPSAGAMRKPPGRLAAAR
jgi:hypothetical protein